VKYAVSYTYRLSDAPDVSGGVEFLEHGPTWERGP